MSIKTFFKLIDVKLSVASIIPVLLGSLYAWYAYQTFNILYLVLLVISMVLVQSSANMINDYFDYKKGVDADIKGDEKVLVSKELTPKTVLLVTILFQVVALLIGIFLAIQTSFMIIAVGAFGVIVLYLYVSGPLPISYTPIGEVVSGGTMGILITVTTIFIHSGRVDVQAIWVSIPTAIYIGTILLSNNLSDIQEDKKAGRKTLPVMIGVTKTEKLWIANVIAILLITALLTVFKVYPITVALMVLILFPYRLMKVFFSYPKNIESKGKTMGIIVNVGIRYHLAVYLGLMIAMIIRGFA